MINSKRKAVFLDRDGVINLHRDDYVKNLDELKILPNVPKAIKFLNDLGFIIIVVTNQSVINRKIISIDELDILHSTISSKIAKYGGKIECFYYCPIFLLKTVFAENLNLVYFCNQLKILI